MHVEVKLKMDSWIQYMHSQKKVDTQTHHENITFLYITNHIPLRKEMVSWTM